MTAIQPANSQEVVNLRNPILQASHRRPRTDLNDRGLLRKARQPRLDRP
jgi:hypothetical protein